MGKYIIVGAGGAVGSLLRFAVSLIFLSFGLSIFPFETLIVNLLGSFALAFLYSRIPKKKQRILLFFATGLIGSFTTFSTFSVELLQLVKNKEIILAIIYFLASLIGGLLFIRLGIIAGERGQKHVSSS